MTGGQVSRYGIDKDSNAGGAGRPRCLTHPQFLSRREMGAGQAGEALEDLVVVFHDDEVLELPGVMIAGETPAVGGDDKRRCAGEVVQVRFGRD